MVLPWINLPFQSLPRVQSLLPNSWKVSQLWCEYGLCCFYSAVEHCLLVLVLIPKSTDFSSGFIQWCKLLWELGLAVSVLWQLLYDKSSTWKKYPCRYLSAGFIGKWGLLLSSPSCLCSGSEDSPTPKLHLFWSSLKSSTCFEIHSLNVLLGSVRLIWNETSSYWHFRERV